MNKKHIDLFQQKWIKLCLKDLFVLYGGRRLIRINNTDKGQTYDDTLLNKILNAKFVLWKKTVYIEIDDELIDVNGRRIGMNSLHQMIDYLKNALIMLEHLENNESLIMLNTGLSCRSKLYDDVIRVYQFHKMKQLFRK